MASSHFEVVSGLRIHWERHRSLIVSISAPIAFSDVQYTQSTALLVPVFSPASTLIAKSGFNGLCHLSGFHNPIRINLHNVAFITYFYNYPQLCPFCITRSRDRTMVLQANRSILPGGCGMTPMRTTITAKTSDFCNSTPGIPPVFFNLYFPCEVDVVGCPVTK